MKRIILLLMCVIFLIGCKQTTEHLVCNPDGSGTLEVNMFLPTATLEVINMIFAPELNKLMENSDLAQQGVQSPLELADQVITKETIQGQAKRANLKIEFLDFQNNKLEEGQQFYYKIKFNNIDRLLASKIMAVQVKLEEGNDGSWTGKIIPNLLKEKSTLLQIGKYKNFQNSEKFSNLEQELRESILEEMGKYAYELTVTMPYPLVENSEKFEKVDENSFRYHIMGNLLEDPDIAGKIAGKDALNSHAIWAPPPEEESEETEEIE